MHNCTLLHLLFLHGLFLTCTSLAATDQSRVKLIHSLHHYQLLHVSLLPKRQEAVQQQADNPVDDAGSSMLWSESAYDEMHGASLTFKLVHRDSLLSPLRDPHANAQVLLEQRLARDTARAHALSARARWRKREVTLEEEEEEPEITTPLMSGLKQGSGEYFIRVGVGTPARENYMVIDTGSDITWVQCAPCRVCYEQTDPIFDPAMSYSYEKLDCASHLCSMLDSHTCGTSSTTAAGRRRSSDVVEEELDSAVCVYQAAYGDGSYTEGEFAIETVTFNGATSMKGRIAFGCGHQNEGLFIGAAGIFGLGAGSLSFPSQMGTQISKVFSYCLVDRDADTPSSLIFGHSEPPLGTQFTRLLQNPNSQSTFYYVSLVGITVGTRMLTIPQKAFQMDVSGYGGVIVDSGTSVTRLVNVAYRPLRSAFREAMRSFPFVGGYSIFDTCYDLSGSINVKVPFLSLHFEGGAEMVLPSSNYFIPVDEEGTYCLAFGGTSRGLSIIGNIQQQGFRVVFDLRSSRLGFAPNQC